VQIAHYANADRYATDVFNSASDLLRQAEAYQDRNAGWKPITMTAREAVAERGDGSSAGDQTAGG